MSAIESFMNRKCKRYQIFNRKKREINVRRMNENLMLEKELRMLKFQEEVEQKALDKKLNLKDNIEGESPIKNESIISLDEPYDNDINDEKENGGKKRGISLYLSNK